MSSDPKLNSGMTQVVDPSVRFISQLLDELRLGQLFIPRFQRGDVWSDEDRIELLNSIETRIPIGSIMLWRTQRPMTTRRRIGGHILPAPPDQPPNSQRDYILDGLQRLSTLLRVLVPPDLGTIDIPMLDEDDSTARPIFYDLREQVFRVRGREVEECWQLPTAVLLHTLPLLAFQRRLAETNLSDRNELIDRADRLANSFRTYKIPVVWVVTNRLEDATQAFHRINTKGEKMGEAHMLNALTYRDGFDLQEHLEKLQPTLASVGWDSLDPKFILATVRALCGLDVTQPNAEALKDQIREHPDLIKQAGDALVRAATLLREGCNIPTPFWVPYIYQAVFLAYALRNTEVERLSDGVHRQLIEWFWQTAYTDYLRIGSRYQTQMNTMRALDSIVNGGIDDWSDTDGMKVEVLSATLNFRTARSKLFGLRLAALRPRSFGDGAFPDLVSMLAEHSGAAFQYILPRSQTGPKVWNSPENRILYSPLKWKADQLIFEILGGPKDDMLLQSHALDRFCMTCLEKGDFSSFLKRRRSILMDIEHNFLKDLKLIPLAQFDSDTFFPG